jgi:hypothetical protein
MGGRSGQGTGGGGAPLFTPGSSGVDEYSPSDANNSLSEMSNKDLNYTSYTATDKLDTNWKEVINSYTNRGYYVNAKIVDGNINENDIKYIKTLNASLDKVKSEKGTFYRGMGMNSGSRTEKLVNFLLENKGKNIKMNTFLSTSSRSNIEFGNSKQNKVFFTVVGKNGKNVKGLSSHPGEDEYLFKTGSKFKVSKTSKETKNGKELINITLTEK